MKIHTIEKTIFSERLKLLRQKLRSVPTGHGVYLHKGKNNEILYVGKAKNLKIRLKNYFLGLDQQTPKTRALVKKIYDFEVIVTENEYESLLLENNLIKHNQPNYNILLRDDKTYPYIKVETSETWARVMLTRKRKNNGDLYFGPYSILGQAQQLLEMINKFFPLVKCSPSVFKNVSRPCNYYNIKQCLAPCKLTVEKDEYENYIHSIISILSGKYKEILKKIKKQMQSAAEDLNFEKAALLRNQIKALELLSQNQSVTLDMDLNLDIFGTYWERDLVSFYITNIREGKVVGGSSHSFKNLIEEPLENRNHLIEKLENERIFSYFLCQFYEKKELPSSILFECEKDFFQEKNLFTLNEFLKKKKDAYFKNEKIIYTEIDDYLKSNSINKNSIIKKKIKDLIFFSHQNAKNKFKEISESEQSSLQMLASLKKFLNLDVFPTKIECYDISTFHGSQTVASQVCFKNGIPSKSSYRKYIIKETCGHADDFASLREVISRRFRSHQNLQNLPDLLILDGGTPQVREIAKTLNELGLKNLSFIGLAKARVQSNFHASKIKEIPERVLIPKRNSELFCNEDPETKILTQGSPEFKILTQIRDEAHRFAISFHRKKRAKESLQSLFSNIKGLGAKEKQKLKEAYPKNLYAFLNESQEVVCEKTGIPRKIIDELYSAMKKK